MALGFTPPQLKTFGLEDRLRVCHDLADFELETFQGLPSAGERDQPGDRMILALWGRAAGTFAAVLVLAERTYGEQCGMLARTLFEGMVDAYWIAKRPADAQRLAVLHFRQTRLLTAEHWNDHERRSGDPAMPLFSEDIRDRAELTSLFGPRGQRHWTRNGLPERISEVDDLVPQNREGELRDRYDHDNKLANLLLHGAAMALNDRITEDGLGRTTIGVGPSEQHLANGLRHAYWSYERLILLVAHRRAPGARPHAESLYTTGWPLLQTITGPALKAAGRNGKCPCESGRKSKDCHGTL
jgi:hypothetical protein